MTDVQNLTGGEALARQLAREGVELIFGIPGVQLDHAVDGLAQLDGQIDFWNVRHEQAASYMADGYARGGRDFGVCMVVPGPGLLNAATGIATAYACSSRVLVLAGQLPSDGIGRGGGLLHEVRDQSRLLGSLTKWSAMARCAQDIPGLVRRAVHELRSGRPRPVGLELPMDVLAERASVRLVDVPPHDAQALQPDPRDVTAAARLLAGAARPVIVAGGGVLSAAASEALARLAERLPAPVVVSRNGRGALSDRHPLALGPLTQRAMLGRSDVVLVLGSRLRNPVGPPTQVPAGAMQIIVNADADDLRIEHGPALAVLSDVRTFLEALLDELGNATTHADRNARETVAAFRAASDRQLATLAPQMRYVHALRAAIPETGVLVNELTQVGYVAEVGYPVWQPGTLIGPGYQGTLGYGFPTALGVKAADPTRAVVCITGDGGFGWSLQELATARRYGLGVVTVVFNNSAFGNVRRTQIEDFAGRTLATDLTNPDFIRLGEAFGVSSMRVEGATRLEGALREAIAGGAPTLIEVPLEDCPNPWGLILRGVQVDSGAPAVLDTRPAPP